MSGFLLVGWCVRGVLWWAGDGISSSVSVAKGIAERALQTPCRNICVLHRAFLL